MLSRIDSYQMLTFHPCLIRSSTCANMFGGYLHYVFLLVFYCLWNFHFFEPFSLKHHRDQSNASYMVVLWWRSSRCETPLAVEKLTSPRFVFWIIHFVTPSSNNYILFSQTRGVFVLCICVADNEQTIIEQVSLVHFHFTHPRVHILMHTLSHKIIFTLIYLL